MGLIAWGILLIVLGIVLTFSDLLGFVIGIPLLNVGILLVVVGIVLALVHFVTGAGKRVLREI